VFPHRLSFVQHPQRPICRHSVALSHSFFAQLLSHAFESVSLSHFTALPESSGIFWNSRCFFPHSDSTNLILSTIPVFRFHHPAAAPTETSRADPLSIGHAASL
jgi:hypothetical protein